MSAKHIRKHGHLSCKIWNCRVYLQHIYIYYSKLSCAVLYCMLLFYFLLFYFILFILYIYVFIFYMFKFHMQYVSCYSCPYPAVWNWVWSAQGQHTNNVTGFGLNLPRQQKSFGKGRWDTFGTESDCSSCRNMRKSHSATSCYKPGETWPGTCLRSS